MDSKKLTKKGIEEAAKILNCEVKVIKAVIKVESAGSGFLDDGQVIILFEPHKFWEQLTLVGIRPVRSDICYPSWDSTNYGKVSEQHSRLRRAVKIHRHAALKSASWGMFQIMGFNYAACGCKTLQEFINLVTLSEDSQLKLFCNFVINKGLDDALRSKNWAEFAIGYNGKGFRKNKYDEKLAKAYTEF